MLLSLAIGLPPSSHFIYIPAIAVLAFAIGFTMGSRAQKDAVAFEKKKLEEREARRVAREARNAAADAEAASKKDSSAGRSG